MSTYLKFFKGYNQFGEFLKDCRDRGEILGMSEEGRCKFVVCGDEGVRIDEKRPNGWNCIIPGSGCGRVFSHRRDLPL